MVFEHGGKLSYWSGACRDYVNLDDGDTLDVQNCENDVKSAPVYTATSGSLDLYFITNSGYEYKGFLLIVSLLGMFWFFLEL